MMLRKLRYLLEALLFWMLLPLVRLLGLERASRVFGAVGRWLGPKTGASRALRRRISNAMPEKSATEVEAIVSGMWEHLSRVLAELVFLPRFACSPDCERVEIQGEEHLRQAIASGRGLFLLTGHFGNWELVFPVLARLTEARGMNGVYRPLNNALLERQLFQTRLRATRAAAHESLRATVGEQLIPKIGNQQRNIREILRVLQRREMLVMLVDQRASQGVEARLFGLPAMTTHLPAQLAITGGHILLPLSMFRKDGVEFVFRFHEPIAVPEPPADDAAVLALTQKINDFLEASIREHPEQWLWLHDRWRPKKRD